MDIISKIVGHVFPVLPYFPRWSIFLFSITFVLVFGSIIVYFVLHPAAAEKKTVSRLLSPNNLEPAITGVEKYRELLQGFRDRWDDSGDIMSQEQRALFEKDYERLIRPYVVALKMNKPGEKEHHGHKLRYDNPVDLATQEFSYFHLNLALSFLNSVIGRLEYIVALNSILFNLNQVCV